LNLTEFYGIPITCYHLLLTHWILMWAMFSYWTGHPRPWKQDFGSFWEAECIWHSFALCMTWNILTLWIPYKSPPECLSLLSLLLIVILFWLPLLWYTIIFYSVQRLNVRYNYTSLSSPSILCSTRKIKSLNPYNNSLIHLSFFLLCSWGNRKLRKVNSLLKPIQIRYRWSWNSNSGLLAVAICKFLPNLHWSCAQGLNIRKYLQI
jgi:hypothetical protein